MNHPPHKEFQKAVQRTCPAYQLAEKQLQHSPEVNFDGRVNELHGLILMVLEIVYPQESVADAVFLIRYSQNELRQNGIEPYGNERAFYDLLTVGLEWLREHPLQNLYSR